MLKYIIASTLFIAALLAPETHASDQSNDCSPLQGWEAVRDKSENGFLIFGELHGTEQSPEAFTEYVCAVSKPNGDETGDSVLIAIEFNSQNDALFRKAWEASEDDFISEVTDKISAWKWRQDGVASHAMLAALKRLHTLKSRGHNIDITAFNGAKNNKQREKFKHLKGSGPHEASQAENIRSAAQRGQYDHVVILVGNLHAEKTRADFGLGEYDLMAMKLAETEKVISLQQLYLDGTSWNCISKNIATRDVTSKDIICEEYSSRANAQNIGGTPRMALWTEGDAGYAPSFDGYYFVGPITASKPAGTNAAGDYLCTIVEKASIENLHLEDSDPPKARVDEQTPVRFKMRLTKDGNQLYSAVELPYAGPHKDQTDWHTENTILHDIYSGDGTTFTTNEKGATDFFVIGKTIYDNEDGEFGFHHSGFEWRGGEDNNLSIRWGRCKKI